MIRKRFLTESSRQELLALARDVSATHGLARRANAIVLLDRGMNCEAVGKVLLVDDDTVRTWHQMYQEGGLEGLARLGYVGSECRLNEAQLAELKASITATLPRTSREVGAWILERDSFSLHRPSPPPGHPRNYNHMGGRVGERAGADST